MILHLTFNCFIPNDIVHTHKTKCVKTNIFNNTETEKLCGGTTTILMDKNNKLIQCVSRRADAINILFEIF